MFLIYGAGKFGRDYIKYAKEIGINDFVLTDSNELLWGKKVFGYIVKNPNNININEIEYILCAVPPKIRNEVKNSIKKRYGNKEIRDFDFPIIRFDDGELEISIVTYNRYLFVKQWIENCFEDVSKRNIRLSIYDGSTNNDTEDYICELTKKGYKIEYYHVGSDIDIGYKPMLPILNTKSRYVWVIGDSRTHDFEELDRRVFPRIIENLDYISLNMVSNVEYDGKIYEDKQKMINDTFANGTCIGMSIYKTSIFEKMRNDNLWLQICDQKYRNNYAFAWLGYFYEAYAQSEYKACFVDINTYTFKGKTISWADKFYYSWIENLFSIIDQVPDVFFGSDFVDSRNKLIKRVWAEIGIDSKECCYLARKNNGLNASIYKKYLCEHKWDRASNHKGRIFFYACAPMWLLDRIHHNSN